MFRPSAIVRPLLAQVQDNDRRARIIMHRDGTVGARQKGAPSVGEAFGILLAPLKLTYMTYS
jgi:hypothetical protein